MVKKTEYKIYTERECKEEPYRKKVQLFGYVVGENAPVVLICPGGAYKFISDFNEGEPFAREFNKRGINAFVLFYSVGYNARYPRPVKDVARSMQFIKANAERLCVDGSNISLMGSSAGGHLCAFFSSQCERYETEYCGKEYSLTPKTLMLCYPLITMGEKTHKVSRRNFLGLFPGKTEINASSVEKLANGRFPPTFVWACEDDGTVDYNNSVMLCDALRKNGVPHEFKLFKTGGHGIGLANGKEPEGWFDSCFEFYKKHI